MNITKEMLDAGKKVLGYWIKDDIDYADREDCCEEIFTAMVEGFILDRERLAEAINLIPTGEKREAALMAFREVFPNLYFFVREDFKVDVVSND